MTNEKIYENVIGHKPNKEFGVKVSFSWDDIDALMNAVKNCYIPVVVERSDPLFCPKCNSTQRIDNDNDAKYTCSRCGTRWAK